MTNTNSSSSPPETDRIVVASKSRQVNRLTGVQILSTGSYAPENVVPNESLAELGYDAEWIVKRTGIQARCWAADDQATSDIAYEAAVRCLKNGNIDISEIDLILLATITPDQPTPSTACHVQRMLGSDAPAMDIGAACAGFMYALITGMQFVACRTYKRVLVIGADLMSRTVNPKDMKTFPLFGDGAGAVVIGPGTPDQGFHSYTLGADGNGEFGCGFGAILRLRKFGCDHRHRGESDRQSPGRRNLLQECGQERLDPDRDGPARPGPVAPCIAYAPVQGRFRCRAAQRDDAHHRR